MLARIKQTFLDYHHRTSRLGYGPRVVASVAAQFGRAESLLDIGCGDGTNTRALAAKIGATRVAGVDVLVRPTATIDVVPYDGVKIPFPDRSFEAVCIIDVLHHCDDPKAVLQEALRVAGRALVVKDHFVYGPLTRKLLYWMDRAGNAKDGIPVPGNFLEPQQWVALIAAAGGRVISLDWPLKTHDLPWRIVGWPQFQFTALIAPVR